MFSYAIPEYWYNDIKDIVPHGEPYFYEGGGIVNKIWVEVDVDEETFIKVSKERGWMA